MVADRHHGDDLLRVEEERQRPLDRHRGLDRRAGLIDAAHPFGEPRVVGIGAQEIVVVSHCGVNNVDWPRALQGRRRGLGASADLAPPAGFCPAAAKRLRFMANSAGPRRRDSACQRAPGDYSAPARRKARRRAALRRDGRVAEGARLESVYTGNRIVGSNPTPSATNSVFPIAAPFCFPLWHFSRIFRAFPPRSQRGLCAETNFGPIEAD